MRLLTLALLTLAFSCAKPAPAGAPAPTPAVAPVAAMPERPGAARAGISGKVLETLEAPSYTYLRLGTASGEQWAAIPTTAVAVGAEVTLANPTMMTNFVSKTLNRTFAEIYFSTGVDQPGAAAAPHAALPKAGPADPQAAALTAWAEQADVVAKATGPDAKTIAEIYLQRAALTGKPVLLRGKVVKYTAGVMGKNWLHLRDGTGAVQSKDNDITVTTGDQAAVGDVVSVRGPVHLDRDFGAGYVFPVLIEDAKVVR